MKEKQSLGLEKFIEKATLVHKNFYTYDNTVYINNRTHVEITCPIHGIFKQRPEHHLTGSGCSKCSNKLLNNAWSAEGWEEKALKSSWFEGFQLYLLKCFNDKETFLKIGKTFTNINRRYASKHDMPYEFIVLDSIIGTPKAISELEQKIHNEFTQLSYYPQIDFGGSTECYLTSSYKYIRKKFYEI